MYKWESTAVMAHFSDLAFFTAEALVIWTSFISILSDNVGGFSISEICSDVIRFLRLEWDFGIFGRDRPLSAMDSDLRDFRPRATGVAPSPPREKKGHGLAFSAEIKMYQPIWLYQQKRSRRPAADFRPKFQSVLAKFCGLESDLESPPPPPFTPLC